MKRKFFLLVSVIMILFIVSIAAKAQTIATPANDQEQKDPCCKPSKCYILVGDTLDEDSDLNDISLFRDAIAEAEKDCKEAGLEVITINPATRNDFKKAFQDICTKEIVVFAHGPGEPENKEEKPETLMKPRRIPGSEEPGGIIYGDDVRKWLNESFGGSGQAKHPCLKKAILHFCGVNDEWREILGLDEDHFYGPKGNTNPLFTWIWQSFHSQRPEELDFRKIPTSGEDCEESGSLDEAYKMVEKELEPKIDKAQDGKTNFYATEGTRQLFVIGVHKENGKVVEISREEYKNPDSGLSFSSNVLFDIMSKPVGSQFEDPCGNGQLDRGEACDYGTDCPNGMVCSDICDCIYPGQGNPLPPRTLPESDDKGEVIVAETGVNTGFFARLFSGLMNIFAREKVSEDSAKADTSDECYCGGQDQGNHRDCYRRFNEKAEKEGYRTPVVCDCSDGKCECSYCKEKRNRERKSASLEETKTSIKVSIAEETGQNTGIFTALRSLFKNVFKIELKEDKKPDYLTDKQQISGPSDTAPQKACSGNNQFEDSSCLDSCNPNQRCEADSQNPGCYRCNPVCANDEYYDDSNCGGLCTEGVNKCVQTSEDPPCYFCKPTCKRGEFYNDPNCGGLCFKDQKCTLTNQEGPCYSCQPLQEPASVSPPIFRLDKTAVSQNEVLITGTIEGNAKSIKYTKAADLFRGKTEYYPFALSKDKTSFTFKEKLELGSHLLTLEAELENGQIARSGPISVSVEQQEKCAGTNIYKDSDCLNACYRNQKCESREYPAGCYSCISVCGAGEYYKDANCAGLCTRGVNECVPSNEKDCYFCRPLASGYLTFEFKDIDQDYKQVSTLIYGHNIYFIVASNVFDVRKQLPITIAMIVSGEEVFRAKIPNEPELHCRDATGCSIAGPFIKSEWQGKPISLKAYNSYNTVLVDYRQ